MESIRKIFWEADEQIQHHPVVVPGLGLFEYPQWRYAIYGALFQPSLLFSTLAELVHEVHTGTARGAMAATLKAQAKGGLPIEPPLKTAGLANGIESIWSVKCLDSGIQFSNATECPMDMFKRYRDVSEIGRNYAYYDIICRSELSNHPELSIVR